MIIRFGKKPFVLTMASRFSRQKVLHRSQKYNGGSIHHQTSRDLNDKNRSKFYETLKRYKSDNYRYSKTRNEVAEKNNKRAPTEQSNEYRKDEKIRGDREKFESSRRQPKSLIEEIEKMLQIEDHHVISSKDATNVEWCPKFVKPDIKGHVRGGKDELHHRCRHCKRLCLHLLGSPGTRRLCLECSAKWEKKYIPVWYYHNSCKYCRKK